MVCVINVWIVYACEMDMLRVKVGRRDLDDINEEKRKCWRHMLRDLQ